MDLLKSVLGGLAAAGQGGAAAPQAGGADAIAALAPVLLEMLSGKAAAGGGGLAGLVAQLSQAGLGDIVQSWVGQGQNLPVSGDQLAAALGEGQLGRLGQAAGLDVSQLGPVLAQVLPGLVDQLTPQGRLPTAGEGGPDLGALLGGLLR